MRETIEHRTIGAVYGEDHALLNGYFLQFRQLKRPNFPQAKGFFKKFHAGLERHIAWEEQILFPLFEKKTGLKKCGPTEVMRDEHIFIKELLERIHAKVRRESRESDADEYELLDVLNAHHHKEESILYPVLDRMTGDDEKGEVFHRMEKSSEKKGKTCCCHVGF